MPIPLNARVRQIVPTIEGRAVERRFSEAIGGMEYRVPYEVDGVLQERWFAEGELEVLPAEEIAS